MHEGQLSVSAATVRQLVAEQFPEWADEPVTEVVSHGTVNALFRIGDRFGVRFPLQGDDPAAVRRSLEAEAAAAAELAGRTSFRTPEPVALGEPGAGYPLPWSVQTWVPGTPATPDAPGWSVAFARDLATFVREVRTIDTAGRTFDREGRGGLLPDSDDWMETCFERSERLMDVSALRRLWSDLRELPRTGADVMTHGDLIPGNVLVAADRLAGIIDVGGFGPADPALDLVAAWHLLDPEPRQAFRDHLGCSDLEWQRGKAWALQQAMGLVWYYEQSNPPMSLLGRRTLERLLGQGFSRRTP
ncbi:aminoglycoside phosphotransferase [Kribbella flavida DSM 17836]|uniref:Aminoglycoside phosphotransferase n=1 Tax=Kribbella flavida (strain DSM 17836 / JCM 10339 / NBRC 14399) TaxID=479435 RepID=D2Q2U3_KRIFD|nr:aminoglycoside phosphotransferase family protein [Kribbella flavida]ADB30274.1 aminoglycoside phosphotransferase [Kribbella flavida DSM 17836]